MAEPIESGSDTEESSAPKRTPPHSVTPAAPQGSESDDGLSEGDLDEVLEDLSPVAVKYKRIGLRLGVKCNEIEKIEKQYSKDPDECLYEVLRFRLKQIPALTRPDIYKALMSQSVNEQRLARKLQKSYGLRQPLQCELLEKSDIAMGRSKKEHCKEMDPENVEEKDGLRKERLKKESVSSKNREMVSDIAKRHKVARQSEVSRMGLSTSSTSLSSDDESGVTVRGHEMAAQKKGKGKAPLHDTELSKQALKNSDKCKGEKTTPEMTVQVLPTKSSKMKSKERAKQGVSGSRKQSRTTQVRQAEQSNLPDAETTSTVKDVKQELFSGDQEYEERIKTKKRRKTNRKSDRKEKLVHLKELQTDDQTAAIDSSSVEDLSSDDKAVDEVRQKTREEQHRKREKVAKKEKHVEHSELISKPMNVTHVEDTRERKYCIPRKEERGSVLKVALLHS